MGIMQFLIKYRARIVFNKMNIYENICKIHAVQFFRFYMRSSETIQRARISSSFKDTVTSLRRKLHIAIGKKIQFRERRNTCRHWRAEGLSSMTVLLRKSERYAALLKNQ